MPISPLKEFEYEISTLMPSDKVNAINVKLNHLHKLKSEGKDIGLIYYYIHELTKMKDDAYPIYSHLNVYLPEYGVLM